MTEASDEQLKRQLPFDQYGRYALIRDIIGANRGEEGKSFRVLDVGGRGNLLRKFLPEDEVFYLDPDPDAVDSDEDANFIRGDGREMPLEDGEFDFVVSADVYEHIPPEDRRRYLDENLRVALKAVILAAPFASRATAAAERYANETYRIISGGEDHAWLKEHIEHGLPDGDELEAFIHEAGYSFQVIPNNSIWLWENMIFANFIFGEAIERFRDFNAFYNSRVFPYDHEQESYRHVYFIKKEAALRDLELEAGGIDAELYLEIVRKSQAVIAEIIAAERRRIEQLAVEGHRKDGMIAQLAQDVENLKREVERRQRMLGHKDRELRERTAELERVYASKSWAATRPMRGLWRSASVIRNEGPREFARKAAGYVSSRLPASISSRIRTPAREQGEIRRWYRDHKRPVTIIIPSYNDHQVLAPCLRSIEKTVEPGMASVIVVDDASSDQAHLDFLRSVEGGGVRVIYSEENGGFARTVNRGLRAAAQGDVVILNSDTTAEPGWLQALQYGACSEEEIGIVGAKLLYPDGRIQFAGTCRNPGAPQWFDHYYRFQPSDFPPANIPNYVLGVTGACMYVKRSVIDEIGFLDEGFRMAFEDMDYCLRAWEAGYKCFYYPPAVLYHHESATRTKQQGEREMSSLNYFWDKWGDWFDRRDVMDEQGRLHVIYVLQSTGVGGGHRLVFEHLNRLQAMGVNAELYALEGPPDWFPLDAPVREFADYSELVDALKREDAVKVATWWETAVPVWLASVSRGIPVYYVQDIETSYYRDDPYMQSVVLSRYRKEFNYITESHWNGRQLEEMGVTPAMVGCGIDENIFRPLEVEREEDVLLTLGRSHYLKNLPMTIDGWKAMGESRPRLWMFGIEPALAEGLEGAEYFLRPSDEEVNELYNRATVFVQTSRHEGFCLPVLEAMAAGAPVICTDAHGNADFCEHERNCLMVGQEDPQGLKQALERLFADKELQERLRAEGYRTAAEYTWDRVMQQMMDFFESISGARATLERSPGQ